MLFFVMFIGKRIAGLCDSPNDIGLVREAFLLSMYVSMDLTKSVDSGVLMKDEALHLECLVNGAKRTTNVIFM